MVDRRKFFLLTTNTRNMQQRSQLFAHVPYKASVIGKESLKRNVVRNIHDYV